MTRFSAFLRQSCIEVMDTIMKHPIAKNFYEIEVEDIPGHENEPKKYYFGLKDVIERFNNNKYNTLNQWERDVNQVWTNAERANPHNSLYTLMAGEMERLFKKEVSYNCKSKIAKWATTIARLDRQLEDLFSNPPPIVSAFSKPVASTDVFPSKTFSEEEIKTFVRVSKYANSEADYRALYAVIKRYQPDFEIAKSPAEIDVSDLNQETMVALRNFVVERLAHMNIRYPR